MSIHGIRCSSLRVVAIVILLCARNNDGSFVSPPQHSKQKELLRVVVWASKRNDATNNSSKRRRFEQDAHHHLLHTEDPMPQNRDTESTTAPQKTKATDISSSSKKEATMENAKQKSIDELEKSMMKRWGTKIEKWTAFDSTQYKLVHNDDDRVSSNDRNNSASNKRKRRQVPDPWQKAESAGKAPSIDLPKKVRSKAATDSFSKKDPNAFLKKVKKNQERLQRSDTSRQNFHIEEDADRYEGTADPHHKDDGENSFHTDTTPPKSMGERGTRGRATDERSVTKGIFFKTTRQDTPDSKVVVETKITEKRTTLKKPLGNSILDEHGKEMYLTLEQAQQNVDVFLRNTDHHTAPPLIRQPSWQEIGITNDVLVNNLAVMKCLKPLSVQQRACPPVVNGNDVLVSTPTGSGKTLAFLVPLAQRLLCGSRDSGVKVLIVAPGRELASQIVSVARELLVNTGLTTILSIGGTSLSRNVDAIRKTRPDILVGTPGRIAELVVGRPGEKSGRLKLNSVQCIVLDEVDALLEYEPHRDPTAAIQKALLRQHGSSLQSIMCSATAGDLKNASQPLLRPGFFHAQAEDDDELITSGQETRVSRTAIHGVVHVPHRRFALDMLKKILYTNPTPQQVLIFVDNARRVGIVVEKLAEMGIVAAPLHGGSGSEKGERSEVNKALREGYVGMVVATEMAARGIDAPYLTHVINLDLPTDASHYAHRAGRCGRGGRPGVVINMTNSPKERTVPSKLANALGIPMYTVEPRNEKLILTEDTTSSLRMEDDEHGR